MNAESEKLTEMRGSMPAQFTHISRALVSSVFVFALVVFVTLESKMILHFVRHSVNTSGFGSYGLFMTLGLPLIVAVLAIGAYVNVKRVVSSVSEDPAILRAITFYGLMVLGFAFLTMDLIF